MTATVVVYVHIYGVCVCKQCYIVNLFVVHTRRRWRQHATLLSVARFTLYAHIIITTAMPFNCCRSICMCSHTVYTCVYLYVLEGIHTGLGRATCRRLRTREWDAKIERKKLRIYIHTFILYIIRREINSLKTLPVNICYRIFFLPNPFT